MILDGVGQRKHLATRTRWAQHTGHCEVMEVQRISRVVSAAECFACYDLSKDLSRALVPMGGRGQERPFKKLRMFLRCTFVKKETWACPRRRDGRCLPSARLANPKTACGIAEHHSSHTSGWAPVLGRVLLIHSRHTPKHAKPEVSSSFL